MTRRAARALALAALCAACGGSQAWVYEKKGVTPTTLDHDMASCRQQAMDPKAFAIFASGRIDRGAFNRCMERKGYTVKPAE